MRIRILLCGLALASGLTLITSCSGGSETGVSVRLGDKFPEIKITGQEGEVLSIISPDDSTGSIGYITDGRVTWLEGLPEQSVPAENNVVFTWSSDGDRSIVMTAEKTGGDIMIRLAQAGKDKTDISGWILNIGAAPDEFFTGIFERVVDGHQKNSWADGIETALDLRGQLINIKLQHTVSAYAPFYLSSADYGLFVHGTWPGVIDFCNGRDDIVNIMFEGPGLDFTVYSDVSPMEIVKKHAMESGPSYMPPEWAFGPWRWRDEHSNNAAYYDGTAKRAPYNTDMVEDVLMMKAFDIPFTATWIDRPWAVGSHGFSDYEWDLNRFPDPEGMIRWLNSNNKELMIWIAPYVIGKMAEYAEANNYYLVSKMHGNAPDQVLMDFTNPDAVKWWGENGPGKMARMGIRGFKLDRADGEKLLDSLHLTAYDGRSYRENYNDFPRQYVNATFDAVKPILGDNFVLFPRAQYTGSSRYGAMWAGDTDGKPEGLRSAIIGVQRCAVMGYPIWGSDIGGYWGSFSRETAMRWLAFGCFSPIMEVGPTNNKGFWDNPGEPHFDSQLIAVWRLYSKIRMQLKDYVTEQAQKAHDDGTPVIRPLFLVFPDQKESWKEWQTYMFGPDILVSAIWQSGASEQRVWLPAGETWIDAWSPEGKEYSGGTYLTVEAPLYKIPLFIRKGSGIDLGNLEELYGESLELASEKPDIAALEKAEKWN